MPRAGGDGAEGGHRDDAPSRASDQRSSAATTPAAATAPASDARRSAAPSAGRAVDVGAAVTGIGRGEGGGDVDDEQGRVP